MSKLSHAWMCRGAVVLALALALAACGGGGGGAGGESGDGSTTDNSAEEAAALVSEAKGELETLITTTADEAEQNPDMVIPYGDILSIAVKFNTAADLDPTNGEAAFFGAIANLLVFLDSDTTDAFLARLGWQPFEISGTLDDFLAAYFASFSPPTVEECSEDPTLPGCTITGYFGLPAGEYDYDGDDLLEIGGTGADVTVETLLAYLTVDLPAALQRSVTLLDGISSDFETTLTLTLPPSEPAALRIIAALSGSTQVVEIDYSDVKLIQTALAAARTVLIAPQIATYTGVDAFLEANLSWDEELEEVTLDKTAFEAYFREGPDGTPGTGDEPLLGSLAGTAALKASIDMTLKAGSQFLTSIVSETDDQSDDLIPQSYLLDGLSENPATFDNKQAVVLFFLQPMLQTITELRSSVTTGSASISAYQSAAHIRNWNTCGAPVSGDTEDVTPHNIVPTGLPLSTDDITDSSAAFETSLSTTVPGTSGTPIPSSNLVQDNGAYYVYFSVAEPVNLSIFTRGNGATKAQLGYVDTDGSTIVAWDSDEDSGAGGNFGISIDSAYFASGMLPVPGRSPLTFLLRIDDENDDGFDLYIETAADDGSDGVPIFLKGGGGRTFDVTVYRWATLNASVGGLIDVLGSVGTKLLRTDFTIGDDSDPQNEIPPRVEFNNSDLRNFVKWVFPQVTDVWFEQDGHPLADPDGITNVVGMELESISLPTGVDMPDDPEDVTGDFSGTSSFCAYPFQLSPAFSFEAGFSLIGL